MAKKQLNIKLDDELLAKLNELAKESSKTKTAIISQAINYLDSDSKHDHQQIELLNKQNDQLQMMLSATKAVIQAKDDLIAELKHKKRGFWARLFGWED